jgi:S1-C subfamily serine protease
MPILFLNLTSMSLEAGKTALAGYGYEIVTRAGLTVEEVLALSPEVVVTEASPSDLSCCELIAQLKSQTGTRSSVKVVMIANGGALERARALDLGTDDVISFPLDPVEFAAKIRTLFREREELQTILNYAAQRGHHADVGVESPNGASKGRFWLIPALFALSAVAVLASVLMAISTGGSRKAALQLRAEIVRLNNGLQSQDDFRADRTRGSGDAESPSASGDRDSLKARSEDLRNKVTVSDGADADFLRRQLVDTQNRLSLLEQEGKIAETIVHKYGSSVCLVHVVVRFLDKSGRPLRVVVDATGKAKVDEKGMVQLEVGASGPPVEIHAFGSGFLAGGDGIIITNHHVAEPWWHDDELKELLNHGVKAYVQAYEAYFPGRSAATRARLGRISSKADLATLKLEDPAPPQAELLELDDRSEASTTGGPVVLIGYPTGVEGILARAEPEVAQKIAGRTQNVAIIMSQLASQHLIRPITTQGHIGDVLKDKIVYDAATTSGGSGGPLFNRNGKVIGINVAVIKDFGGSNLAVPARYATDLLR